LAAIETVHRAIRVQQMLYYQRCGKKSVGRDGTQQNAGANVDNYFHTNGTVMGQIAEI
jgi:hypothetical protein